MLRVAPGGHALAPLEEIADHHLIASDGGPTVRRTPPEIRGSAACMGMAWDSPETTKPGGRAGRSKGLMP